MKNEKTKILVYGKKDEPITIYRVIHYKGYSYGFVKFEDSIYMVCYQLDTELPYIDYDEPIHDEYYSTICSFSDLEYGVNYYDK